MPLFKNATAATAAATGLTVILDVPFTWTTSILFSTFATVYYLPDIVNGLKNLKERAVTLIENNKPRAKAIANDAAKKAKEVAWAVSPTNPEQNATVGAALGFAASNVAGALMEVSSRNYPILVGAATVASGVAGHYLPNKTVEAGIMRASLLFSSGAVGKVAKPAQSKAPKTTAAAPIPKKKERRAANDPAKLNDAASSKADTLAPAKCKK